MREFFLFAIGFVLFSSCDTGKSNLNPIVDSEVPVLQRSQNSKHKTIKVPGHITNAPLSSDIVEINGKEKLLLLDNQKIYIFDWEAEALEDSIDLSRCGSLQNYSGFKWVNEDSIWVYNYSTHMLSLVDKNSNIREYREIIPKGTKNAPIDIEALDYERIGFHNGNLYFSGGAIGNIKDAGEGKRFPSLVVNADSVKHFLPYSDIYYSNSYSLYMNAVSHDLDDEGNFIQSFPPDHFVYIYSADLKDIEKIYMGSRYIKSISPNPSMMTSFDRGKMEEYYALTSSYGNIIYDKYRGVYYRVAEMPIDNWTRDDIIKPFSIIAMDKTHEIIGETDIIPKNENLLHLLYICREGLTIRKRPEGNKLDFIILDFVNE
ncbi:MAG: DUF4221 domain-containing protein [Bacteroidales bacterium]|nr:DUF4221 domain-containing protein [Bacteroidales bacterium]